MSFKQFLTSRTFVIQLIIAVILVVALLLGIMKGLKSYTHHGESYPVPNFSNLSQNEAAELAKKNNFKIEVIDSVHVNDVPPGAVVDQVPEEGFRVKRNRLIYLTINATSPENILVPKLTDISFRQAQVLIENCGLTIGQILYQPSEFNDLVLEVQIDSVSIAPGQKLPKGTSIDLIIGRNQGNTTTILPDVKGLTIQEAVNKITSSMLNTGVLIYDASITTSEDSLNAKIWRQLPDTKGTSTINMGSSVDLWLTVDSLKLNFLTNDNLQ